MLWSRLAAAVLSGCALLACSNQEFPTVPLPLEECPDADYTPCDTHDAACQEQLLVLAACIYGVNAPTEVPVRVLTERELADELATEPSDAEAAALPHRERALVDLKLLKEGALTKKGGATADLVKRVSGMYQDAERGVVLVDRGEAMDDAEADGRLIHELVHALQDSKYDLPTWRAQYPSDTDTELALRSVTEGQATLVQYRAWAAMAGQDASTIDWESTFLRHRNELFTSARADDLPYFAVNEAFPSGFGATLANLVWSTDGANYHKAQFDKPPQMTLEVLAQNAQREASKFDAPPFVTPTLSDDDSAVEDTALGALLLELAAHQLGDDSDDPLPLLLAWRGDRLSTFVGPNAESAWLWQVQVVDAATAQSLQRLAKSAGLTSEAKQKRLFLLGGDEPPTSLLDAGRAFLDADY